VRPAVGPPVAAIPAATARGIRAAQILGEFAWEAEELALLEQFLEDHRSTRSLVGLRQSVDQGLNPDQVRLVLELRRWWRECDEFHASDESWFPRPNLSWQLATQLVTMFQAVPDMAELEVFFVEALATWRSTEHDRQPSFHAWLEEFVASTPSNLTAYPLACAQAASTALREPRPAVTGLGARTEVRQLKRAGEVRWLG
jgi:hypothetical protein